MISSVRNFVVRILDADRFTIALFQILDIRSNYLPGMEQLQYIVSFYIFHYWATYIHVAPFMCNNFCGTNQRLNNRHWKSVPTSSVHDVILIILCGKFLTLDISPFCLNFCVVQFMAKMSGMCIHSRLIPSICH
jgi:hypothetical protein